MSARAINVGELLHEAAETHRVADPITDRDRQDRGNDLERLGSVSSDLYCGTCGYGIAVYVTPPDCPMCGSRSWWPQERRMTGIGLL